MALDKNTLDASPQSPAAIPSPAKGGKNLLVNYASLLGGTVAAKGLSLLTVLMLTRYLGVEDFGRYSLVFSFWALMNTLVDFGGSQILGRDLAREPDSPRGPIEAVVYLRLLGCLVFLPLGVFLAPVLGLGTDLLLIGYFGIFVGFEAYYDVYFSATMQLDKNAKARLAAGFGNVILMALAILAGLPLPVIILLALANPLLKLLIDYRFAPFRPLLRGPDWARIRRVAMDGWPLWFAGIQYILLARIDTLMLQVLTPDGAHELGIYAAAFRFSEIMALLINALCPALLPLLVAHSHHPEQIRFMAGTGTRAVLALLAAISLFIFWYAPWISAVYGPGYEAAALCMRILIWSQALVAVNTLCYQLLLVYNAQGRKPVMMTGVVMTLLNIGLNALLIPKFHAVGAAWATVITEAAIVLAMLYFLRRYTPVCLVRDILLLEVLTLLACLPPWLLGDGYGWVSIPLFLGLVFGLKLLTPASLRRLAQERLPADPTNPSSTGTTAPHP